MPPEQALNTRRADHRADIYSLGCTLYFLLTGQPIHGGDTVMERLVAHREHAAPSLRKACPAAPRWLEAVFQKMVAKKPEDRYQSMAEVMSALERHVAPLRKKRRRVMAARSLCLILAGFLVLLRGKPQQDPTDGGNAIRQSDGKGVADSSRLENHLTAGRRLCFVENKWADGLLLLAQCDDAPLQQLATAELTEAPRPGNG